MREAIVYTSAHASSEVTRLHSIIHNSYIPLPTIFVVLVYGGGSYKIYTHPDRAIICQRNTLLFLETFSTFVGNHFHPGQGPKSDTFYSKVSISFALFRKLFSKNWGKHVCGQIFIYVPKQLPEKIVDPCEA